MSDIRIVIVEDNPADVLLVREALAAQGIQFSLEDYSNGEDAAKAIAAMTEPPNLFLLDLNIPRVHGLELLRIVRARPALSQVPVVVLTSSQSAADKALSERYGANAYVVKPPGYYEFVANVGSAVSDALKREPRASCRLNDARAHVSRGAAAARWSIAISVSCAHRLSGHASCAVSTSVRIHRRLIHR